MGPAWPEAKNDCVGKSQQQFSTKNKQTQDGTEPDQTRRVSQELRVGIYSWWLAVRMEAEEFPLLEAATKQWLVKMQQNEKT
jgi:hypothetical protein